MIEPVKTRCATAPSRCAAPGRTLALPSSNGRNTIRQNRLTASAAASISAGGAGSRALNTARRQPSLEGWSVNRDEGVRELLAVLACGHVQILTGTSGTPEKHLHC